MPDYKLNVYIDVDWVTRMKNMEFNLCIAKKINNSYTVVWNSKDRDYNYENVFEWTDEYQVGAIHMFVQGESLLKMASAKKQPIDFGQTVVRDENGVLRGAVGPADPKAASFTVSNKGGQTYVVVDQKIGNKFTPVWADPAGIPIADMKLTPRPKVMVFFHKEMTTGVMFAEVLGEVLEIDFTGTTERTVSYVPKPKVKDAAFWKSGGLEDHFDMPQPVSYSVTGGFQPLDTGDETGDGSKN